MKRKALVILTVAILAFAMIPALGANAGEGEVVIVTPDELSNPDGSSGSAFSRLEGAEFVSTQTGTDTDLQDAAGTVFIVIEDNDAQSNTLRGVVATFNTPSASASGRYFIKTGSAPGSETPADTVAYTDGTPLTADEVANLVIADRNRSGSVEPDDITVKFGTDVAFSRISTIGETTVGVDTLAIGGANLILEFSTSTTDSLISTKTGESLVEVRSTSGEAIKVHASEKSLSAYRMNDSGGINNAAFKATDAVSQDSGVFVAMIGLIENDWKLMISEWVSDDGEDDSPLKSGETVKILIDSEVVRLVEAADNEPESTQDITVVLAGDNAPGPSDFLFDRNSDGVINQLDASVVYVPGEDSDSQVTAVVTSVTVSSGVATVGVKLTGVVDETFASDAVATTTDSVKVTFETTGSIDDLMDEIGARIVDPIDGHNAFDDLCVKTDVCPEATALMNAINAHAKNLGLGVGTTGASIFANSVVGVSDGDDLEIRYSDPTPGEGTQRASATVDTIAPTIGGFDPANDSFTTDDRFDSVFTVTDGGSGIFEDAEEQPLLEEIDYIEAYIVTRVPGGTNTPRINLDAEEDEDVNDGYLYEVEINVRDLAEEAEEDNENLEVVLTVTAYDIARNSATKSVTYTVDVIDPELLGAITGWGVSFSGDADRAEAADSRGAYILQEGQLDAIALVFNGPVDGNSVRANSIAIAGHTVSSITWLDNEGANVLSIGSGSSEDLGSAVDIDFNKATRAGNQANGFIEDGEGAGLELSVNALGQDTRHILFAEIDGTFDTDSRPAIEIDRDDLSDLAGNENGDDHSIARARDGIAPKFTVVVVNKLSNDVLDVTIEASEALERSPSAEITLEGSTLTRSLDVDAAAGGTSWVVNEDRETLGLTAKGGIQDGIWTIEVTGTDENDNTATVATKTWELDTRANGGVDPVPDGQNAKKEVKVETDSVIFLSLTFGAESDEYDGGTRGKDSATAIAITAITMETLDADGKVVADSETELPLNTAQSNDGKRFVIALSDAPIGDHQLAIEYSDNAGNTDDYDFEFSVIAQQATVVPVSPGWSLISIPGRPQSVSIGDVLDKSKVTDVWSLNNETNQWEFAKLNAESGEFDGTLTQIVDGRGYFVRSTTFDPISVLLQRFDPQRTPPQYPVSAGWNSVGYTPAGEETEVSVDGYLSSLGTSGWGMIRMWNADETPPRYETYYSSGVATDKFPTDDDGVAVVEAGKGYLLFATRNGVIGG